MQDVGGLVFILTLPQAGQTGGSAQFPGFGLLLASDIRGLMEIDFNLVLVRGNAQQQQFPCER